MKVCCDNYTSPVFFCNTFKNMCKQPLWTYRRTSQDTSRSEHEGVELIGSF